MTRLDIERLARAGDIARVRRNHSRRPARAWLFLAGVLLLLAVLATCAGVLPAAASTDGPPARKPGAVCVRSRRAYPSELRYATRRVCVEWRYRR
jgi:hypothetical protein